MYQKSDKYGKPLDYGAIQCTCRSCTIAQYRNTQVPEIAATRVNHYIPTDINRVAPELWRHMYYRGDMLWNNYGVYGRFSY